MATETCDIGCLRSSKSVAALERQRNYGKPITLILPLDLRRLSVRPRTKFDLILVTAVKPRLSPHPRGVAHA